MPEGDGNFLVAVALVLLILVILYGSGCMIGGGGGDAMPSNHMLVQSTAEGPASVAAFAAGTAPKTPIPVTTQVNPAAGGTATVSYEFDPKKVSPTTERMVVQLSLPRPPMFPLLSPSKSPTMPVRVIRTDRDVANLFRPVSGARERFEPSLTAKRAFKMEGVAANAFRRDRRPAQAKAARRREGFVDANGRWQSFAYYHVGGVDDPRPQPLGHYVSSDDVPKVEPGEEAARRTMERFMVPPAIQSVWDEGRMALGSML